MKLFVPHTGEILASDGRLMCLAHLMGICCEPIFLNKYVQQFSTYLEKHIPRQDCCLLINLKVMREWVGKDSFPTELASFLVSCCPHLLVYGMTMDSFTTPTIASLSSGTLTSVRPLADACQPYTIPADSRDICGPFSGLVFGPPDNANDRVFAINAKASNVRKLICIAGHPFMAALRHGASNILFLGSEDTADIHAVAGCAPLSDYFSRLVPHVMALRYIFREECWLPGEPHATIIIDDPLLCRNYGYLNFEKLLRLMNVYNFHSTIAFIPRNYRRNSTHVLRMFRENPSRFSICFHGNDHTRSEFASRNTAFLNTALGIAEERMTLHRQSTGLRCDKVMVFPQGEFSVEAMKVLKSHNFCAAVNTVSHPKEQPVALTLGELAQPAVLRYGGFPLFLRKYARETRREDIAFNLFFGRPILIVEHHDVFRRPETVTEIVSIINSISPEIRWTNLENAVNSSYLKRRTADGAWHVRVYSSTACISNSYDSSQQFLVEWNNPDHDALVDKVLQDGTLRLPYTVGDSGMRFSAELAPSESRMFSVVHRNDYSTLPRLSSLWNARAFVRRRLSEVRDNYISKNQRINTFTKALQRLVFSRRSGPRNS